MGQIVRGLVPGAEVSEADTIAAVCRRAAEGPWRMISLDLGMPEGEPVEMVRAVRSANPATPILVFSMFDALALGPAVVRAGATGFVSKTATRSEVVAACRTLLSGGTAYPPAMQQALSELARPARRGRRQGYAALSAKEREVLRGFGGGHSQKEIAARLGVALSTVGTHRTRILQKLRLRNTSELLCYIAEHRLNGNSVHPWAGADVSR